MKKPVLCLVALILMLVSASALATSGDEALITDTLRQAGITEPNPSSSHSGATPLPASPRRRASKGWSFWSGMTARGRS